MLQKAWIKDISLSAVVAGFVASLVGITSSVVLIFQASEHLGVSHASSASWLGSLCLGMGLVSIIFSLKYLSPILMAWSTPGAALILTQGPGINLELAIGAFLISGFLLFLSGATGIFERWINRIPLSLASALLAGVLFQITLNGFLAFHSAPLLVGVMFIAYILGRRFWPQYSIISMLFIGMALGAVKGEINFSALQFVPTNFVFHAPEFSWSAFFSLALPLFIVTACSQNLTGVSVMRTNGYHTPISPVLAAAGIANLLAAPFGGFAINLAAITAAIGMGPDCHPDPQKRYIAGVSSGIGYLLAGGLAGSMVALITVMPSELTAALAGFALIGTILNSLQKAFSVDAEREPAVLTFLLSASGLTIFGVGSAFWGMLVGMIVYWGYQRR